MSQRGSINPLIVAVVVLSIFVIGLTAFGVWAFVNYTDHKDNVDQKVSAAVAAAKKEQKAADDARFLEQEKLPTKKYAGPSDLGRVEFKYPKTWSGYVDQSGEGSSSYEAYFQPGLVSPVSGKTPYALRVTIENQSYDDTLLEYKDEIERGELTSKPVTVNGESGNRIEGELEQDVQGIMIVFKIRDKTLKIYTESKTFQADFENIILKDLKFSK